MAKRKSRRNNRRTRRAGNWRGDLKRKTEAGFLGAKAKMGAMGTGMNEARKRHMCLKAPNVAATYNMNCSKYQAEAAAANAPAANVPAYVADRTDQFADMTTAGGRHRRRSTRKGQVRKTARRAYKGKRTHRRRR